jgi:DNA-binding protein H-NS
LWISRRKRAEKETPAVSCGRYSDVFRSSSLADRGRFAERYANPDDPLQSWPGRGRKLTWLLAKLKKGAKQEDFEIGQQKSPQFRAGVLLFAGWMTKKPLDIQGLFLIHKALSSSTNVARLECLIAETQRTAHAATAA